MTHASSSRAWARRLLLCSTALVGAATAGCAHEKGEGQVAWLQGSMEAEFPDHDSPVALDSQSLTHLQEVTPLRAAVPSGGTVRTPTASPIHEVPVAEQPGAPPAAAPPDDAVDVRIVARGKTGEPSYTAARADADGKTADPDAKRELDRGLALMAANDFDHAREAFSAFVARWPDHPATETALFGLGQCYLTRGEPLEAADAFGGVLERFPHGAKAPDSLLGLGLSAMRLGREDKAAAYFDRLALEFPKSDAARRIPREHAARISQKP